MDVCGWRQPLRYQGHSDGEKKHNVIEFHCQFDCKIAPGFVG